MVQPINQTTQGLSNPIYAPFAIFDPTQAQIDTAFADADLFTNYSGGAYDPAKVVGILLDRYTNATAQTVRGVDLSYRQSFASSFGTFDAFGNATWIRLKQQTIISLPFQQLSGTIGNVPKFKARGGVTWRRGGLSATLVGNYVAAESDAGVSPAVPIGSWTTADLNLSYAFGGLKATPSGLRLGLAISNLFDKKPPYAVSPRPELCRCPLRQHQHLRHRALCDSVRDQGLVARAAPIPKALRGRRSGGGPDFGCHSGARPRLLTAGSRRS